MNASLWHALEVKEVLEQLGTDKKTGLSAKEVEKRWEEFGLNELKKEKKVSPILLFLNQFKNVLLIILIIAVCLSALIGEVIDAVLIGVIVFFCAVLGFVQEYRAEKAIEALKKMLSPTITVLRDGKTVDISSKELVPGDLLLLEAGDKIPADARVYECHAFRCDEASLTGESLPIKKGIDVVGEKVSVGDKTNMVFAGTVVTYGKGKAIVTSTGMSTEIGKIAKEVTSIKTEKTPLEKQAGVIGKGLGLIALVACSLVAILSTVREAFSNQIDLEFIVTMVMFGVALAVAAVPEALPAIVTGALAIGMQQMAKRNALVRKMPAVETLGCTTVICSDKTGTLTKGEMTVRKIYSLSEQIDVSGAGYEPVGEFKGNKTEDIANSQHLQLFKCGLLCNDAQLYQEEGKWLIKGDPTEGSLIVAASKVGLDVDLFKQENPRIDEVPFSSERKRMTTLHQMKDGNTVAFIKGAPEAILDRCTSIYDENGKRELTSEEKEKLLKINEEMALDALRVLGFAYKEFSSNQFDDLEKEAEAEMVFLGFTGMMDPPREEAIEAIKTCHEVGIRSVMITGDHKLTAVAIAKEMDIYNEGDRVLSGEELSNISQEELEKIVDQVKVYARVSPQDKLKIVKAWKSRGEVVAMTGDGVNDAPALKHADIGVAMGITGTEVSKEAADMILTDDNFATIVKAIERGRWIYDNIKKYLTYLVRCNLTEVIVIGGVVMILGPEFLPLLPAAILYINLATDGPPALALGVAPPDPDIMERPPRNPNESIFSKDVKLFVLLAVVIEIPIFFYFFFSQLDHLTDARTSIFFLFIAVELMIALNFRSMKESIFKAPPHKWLLIAIAWEILLISVLMTFPVMREAFGIHLPTTKDVFIIAAMGVVVFAAMEGVKAYLRRSSATA